MTDICTLQGFVSRELSKRDKKEFKTFEKIVKSHNVLANSLTKCQIQNYQLEKQIEKVKDENTKLHLLTLKEKIDFKHLSSEIEDGKVQENNSETGDNFLSSLQLKLLSLQEELTAMHKRKGENAQLLIDLTHNVREKDEVISCKNKELDEKNVMIDLLKKSLDELKQAFSELETTNQLLKDEQQALQLVFESIEAKYRRCQDENNNLLERWLKLKSQDIDRINMENEHIKMKGINKMRKDLAEAATDNAIVIISPNNKTKSGIDLDNYLTAVVPSFACSAIVPDRILFDMPNSHDSDVTSLAIYPMGSDGGRLFATGGADRKIKMWEIGRNSCDCKYEYVGCSAGVTSIQIDSEGAYLLGSSNDFATRLWTVSDQRLRHTLTGHSGKVLSAKFLDGSRKVVSGSHDRTLKIWDLTSKSCVRTLFAGSSCNDVIVSGKSGSCILSAHVDKKIRVWDLRMGSSNSSRAPSPSSNTAGEIPMPDKITSLDLSNDQVSLLACCRDNTIRVVDMRASLRNRQPSPDLDSSALGCYKAEGFHVAYDWTRAHYSPDGLMIACGSSDGNVYLWNCTSKSPQKSLLEKKLTPSATHPNTAIVTCEWSLLGNYFIACDNKRRNTVWV